MSRNSVVILMMLAIAALLGQIAPTAAAAAAAAESNTAKTLYERVTPSLVAVQFVWESELGRRELVGAGVVVSDDGLVMCSMQMFDLRMPDAQMKEFKIIVPSQSADHDEIDAVFQGRDERTQTAFVRPKSTSDKKWTPLKFDEEKVAPGDEIASIGMLPKN